jgi:hypothetical protein
MFKTVVPFDDLAGVRLVNANLASAVAFARHAGATGAAQLVVPRTVGMVLAHPANAETRRAISVHVKRAGPLQRSRVYRAPHPDPVLTQEISAIPQDSGGIGTALAT